LVFGNVYGRAPSKPHRVENLARTVLVHEWLGLLIIVIAIASLAGTVWSLVQNVYFYECPTLPPEIHDMVRCPGLVQRVSWNVPGLIIGCIVLLFGLWTYVKGKKGVPLISVRSADHSEQVAILRPD